MDNLGLFQIIFGTFLVNFWSTLAPTPNQTQLSLSCGYAKVASKLLILFFFFRHRNTTQTQPRKLKLSIQLNSQKSKGFKMVSLVWFLVRFDFFGFPQPFRHNLKFGIQAQLTIIRQTRCFFGWLILVNFRFGFPWFSELYFIFLYFVSF